MKRLIFILLTGTMCACTNTYVETGPMIGDGLDNSDAPWMVSFGYKDPDDFCGVEAFHLSSLKGGYPFWYGHDDVNITAIRPYCRWNFGKR